MALYYTKEHSVIISDTDQSKLKLYTFVPKYTPVVKYGCIPTNHDMWVEKWGKDLTLKGNATIRGKFPMWIYSYDHDGKKWSFSFKCTSPRRLDCTIMWVEFIDLKQCSYNTRAEVIKYLQPYIPKIVISRTHFLDVVISCI
jgi:hypothetical protein